MFRWLTDWWYGESQVDFIAVKAEHIEIGCHGSTNCPISLAILEQIPGAVVADVTEMYVSITTVTGSEVQFPTSEKMAQFIYRFDSHMKVKPAIFEIPKVTW